MTPQNQTLLKSLGFIFSATGDNNFATIAAEPVDLRPDHFKPRFRDVFLGNTQTGFYVTSHITGEFRKYRARKYNTNPDYSTHNIFGHGKTEDEAVAMFVENFKNKKYNIR